MKRNNKTAKSLNTYLVNLPVEKVYKSTLNHLSKMQDVWVTKKRRSHKIVAQFGSWKNSGIFGRKIKYESGSMEINIDKQGGKSLVSVDFRFLRPYLVSFLFWSVEAFIVIWFGSHILPGIWSIILSYFPALVGLIVVITGLSTRYLVNNTKQRLSSQLHLFFLRQNHRESRRKAEKIR